MNDLEFGRNKASRETLPNGSANLENLDSIIRSGRIETTRDNFNNLLLVSGSAIHEEKHISVSLFKILYDIFSLKKAIDVSIIELVPRRLPDAPDVVPRQLLIDAEGNIDDLEKKIRDLINQLNQLNSELANAIADADSERSGGDVLEQQSGILQKQIKDLMTRILELSEKLASLKAENISLKLQLGIDPTGGGEDDCTVDMGKQTGPLADVIIEPTTGMFLMSKFRKDSRGNYINEPIPEDVGTYVIMNNAQISIVITVSNSGKRSIFDRTEPTEGPILKPEESSEISISLNKDRVSDLPAGVFKAKVIIDIDGNTDATRNETRRVEIPIILHRKLLQDDDDDTIIVEPPDDIFPPDEGGTGGGGDGGSGPPPDDGGTGLIE